MTRAEQPPAHQPAPDDALVADSRERAVRALLRRPQLRRLWSAQLVGGVGDTLALLVLVLLALQTAIAEGSFGGGYRGVARSGDRFRRAHPGDAALRSRPARTADLAHLAGGP